MLYACSTNRVVVRKYPVGVALRLIIADTELDLLLDDLPGILALAAGSTCGKGASAEHLEQDVKRNLPTPPRIPQ